MKKTVRVIVEKEIEVDIPDHMLTPECVADFSKTMWEIQSVDDLFKYASSVIANYETSFIEGIGECVPLHTPVRPANTVVFSNLLHECTQEILPV